jgi:NAD dependent epimerase/dehydratase
VTRPSRIPIGATSLTGFIFLVRALVTGADGFIGSHLVEALVEAGHETRALALYNSFGRYGWLDNLSASVRAQTEIKFGDVRDAAAIRGLVRGCDVVFHLAALIAIPYSYMAPSSYIETNVVGTLNVLEAAREYGAKVVQTSTSEVYGTARCVPISETHPLQGQSPYAASKIGADQLALSFYRSFKLPVIVLRPFNTYGPRQSTRAIIPTTIVQIAAGSREIKLGSLHPTRDFSFVQDTVAGFESAMISDAALGQEVNIGSGFEISVGDTAKLIAECMGIEATISEDRTRVRPKDSEVERLHADITRARSLLGWKPRHGGVEGFKRGLKQTIDWFSQPANLALYRPGEYTI